MSLSKEEIRLSLLDHMKKKGLEPGSILVSKPGALLKIIQISLEDLEKNIDELSQQIDLENTGLAPGTILLFVNAHGVRRQSTGAWDFWYEFLVGEQTFFVPAAGLGDWKLKNEFEVK